MSGSLGRLCSSALAFSPLVYLFQRTVIHRFENLCYCQYCTHNRTQYGCFYDFVYFCRQIVQCSTSWKVRCTYYLSSCYIVFQAQSNQQNLLCGDLGFDNHRIWRFLPSSNLRKHESHPNLLNHMFDHWCYAWRHWTDLVYHLYNN